MVSLKDAIERPEQVRFWGGEYTVMPRLCSRVFGDGRALMYLTPLNTRPNYYVLQVDSSWDLDGDEMHDRIDDIYDALEDQFGPAYDDEVGEREWPALDIDAGSTWGAMDDWPKTL